MKEILKQNYQNIGKDTFMVQTRSQIKSKGVKAPTVKGATKPPVKVSKRKETKPTVIEDTPIIIDLDTKPDLDPHVQDAVVMQQYNPTRPGIRQTPAYSHPILRPPKAPRFYR